MHMFLKLLIKIQEKKLKTLNCLFTLYQRWGDLIYFLFPGWGPSTLFDNFSRPDLQAFNKNLGLLTQRREFGEIESFSEGFQVSPRTRR